MQDPHTDLAICFCVTDALSALLPMTITPVTLLYLLSSQQMIGDRNNKGTSSYLNTFKKDTKTSMTNLYMEIVILSTC